MRFGTHNFPGEAGRHTDQQGVDCPGRVFEAKHVGTGAVYINEVECTTCRREMSASEDRLLPDSTITNLDEAV
jgi:hypothetical protein